MEYEKQLVAGMFSKSSANLLNEARLRRILKNFLKETRMAIKPPANDELESIAMRTEAYVNVVK